MKSPVRIERRTHPSDRHFDVDEDTLLRIGRIGRVQVNGPSGRRPLRKSPARPRGRRHCIHELTQCVVDDTGSVLLKRGRPKGGGVDLSLRSTGSGERVVAEFRMTVVPLAPDLFR